MQTKDFTIFQNLIDQVYQKAFGEPLSGLPLGKANTLAWMIEECTGVLLSYKSLSNYVKAVLHNNPGMINPNEATLSALTQFATGEQGNKSLAVLWYKYRAAFLTQKAAA